MLNLFTSKLTLCIYICNICHIPLGHINSRGETPLMTLLDDLGGWPVLEGRAWRETEFDFVTLMAKLRLLNNRVLISQWVGADDKNSSQNIIQVGPRRSRSTLLVGMSRSTLDIREQ